MAGIYKNIVLHSHILEITLVGIISSYTQIYVHMLYTSHDAWYTARLAVWQTTQKMKNFVSYLWGHC